jgi:hypothetical protein
MYGIRVDFDGSFMLEKTVIQIAIGVGDVQIRLSDAVSISIVSSFFHSASDSDEKPKTTISQKGAGRC